MGKIIGNDGTVTREFTCEQFSHMGYVLPSPWVITENTCPIYFDHVHSPYASFGLDFAGTALPGNWYTYKGVVSLNRVIIPTSAIVLPSNYQNIEVIVRRQRYHATVPGDVRDYTVNNVDNSIDFESSLGLNGQTAYIRVFR